MAYESKFHSPENDALFQAILSLENQEECYRFFEDLLTVKELQTIAQRWQVAGMLKEGRTYADIAGVTSASAATITRVNKSLLYGADGYARILQRLEEEG